MNDTEDIRMIQDLFRKADVDKNGTLNRVELAQIMKQLQGGQGMYHNSYYSFYDHVLAVFIYYNFSGSKYD
jgi:hypothetical protein